MYIIQKIILKSQSQIILISHQQIEQIILMIAIIKNQIQACLQMKLLLKA